MWTGLVQYAFETLCIGKGLALTSDHNVHNLGLSPVARTRVSTTTPPGPKPWEFGLRPSKFEGLRGPLRPEDDPTEKYFR